MEQKKLERLLAQAKLAREKAEAQLLRMYPVGTELQFALMHGQRRPSTGRVLGLGWRDGELRVWHHEAKRNSRYQVRSVHYTNVLGLVV